MDVGSWASAAESEDEEGVAAHGSEDADADADGVASDGGAPDGGGGAGSASVPNRTRAGRRAGRAGRHAHRAFRAATMASESVAKVLAAHITAKGKRTEALAAYFSERRPTGQKVVKEAFQDATGDLRIFFLVFAIINALADVIAVERLVLDREDLAENLILAAFAGQALSTVRAAFKGLAPSTASQLILFLELVRVGVLDSPARLSPLRAPVSPPLPPAAFFPVGLFHQVLYFYSFLRLPPAALFPAGPSSRASPDHSFVDLSCSSCKMKRSLEAMEIRPFFWSWLRTLETVSRVVPDISAICCWVGRLRMTVTILPLSV